MLIVSLDQYIVVVALPEIGRDLGYSAQTLQSVISAYAVASAGFLLLGGRAADLLGRRRVFVTGLALYGVASFAGGLATVPEVQLAARAAAGARRRARLPGHAVAGQHHLRRGPRAQPRAGGLGRCGRGRPGDRRAARRRAHAGLRLGGGVLRQRAADRRRAPARPAADRRPTARATPTRRFDLPGALSVDARRDPAGLRARAGAGAWLGLARDPRRGGGRRAAAGRLRARRAAQPRPARAAAAARQPQPRHGGRDGVLFMATFGSLLYFLSLYFQDVLGYDALQTGVGFLLPTAFVVAGSTIAGRLVTACGLRLTLVGRARHRRGRRARARPDDLAGRHLRRADPGADPGQPRRRRRLHRDLHRRRHRRGRARAGHRVRHRVDGERDRRRRRPRRARPGRQRRHRRPRRRAAADRDGGRHRRPPCWSSRAASR